jgi:predicted RNA methylase
MTNKVSTFLDRDREPVDDLALRFVPQRVAEALRAGRCPPDRAFDRFLPDELRVVSGQYWTPLGVAKRVAEWLDELNVRTVVDIGSGAGKFCVAAALAGHCHFIGLEQRSRLVASARTLARVFGVDDRVSFIEGAFGDIATPIADAYYLYNPFGEYRFGSRDHFDRGLELSDKRHARDVAAVEDLLQRARARRDLRPHVQRVRRPGTGKLSADPCRRRNAQRAPPLEEEAQRWRADRGTVIAVP